MKRLLSLASKLKYNLHLECRIYIIQGHVSFSFRCENFTSYKWYPQGFLNTKVTFQQVSVAETVHTPSFQIDSSCWNCLESPSFSKSQSTETVWNLDTPWFRIAETFCESEFQDWNYAEIIGILKFQQFCYDIFHPVVIFNLPSRWIWDQSGVLVTSAAL